MIEMRPLVKWAGGKNHLATRIDAAFGGPCRGAYAEPFAGGLAVFLRRKAAGAVLGDEVVLNDVNRHLIRMYRCVRDAPEELIAALEMLPETTWREEYYVVRAEFNKTALSIAAKAKTALSIGSPSVLQSARFLWLNRHCFNGLYRENKKGEFNVSVGCYANPYVPDAAHIHAVSALLKGTILWHGGFEAVLRSVSHAHADGIAQAQVYLDPPYVPLTSTANFVGYAADGFGWGEQQLLAETARSLAARGVRVVVSNHDTPEVRRLYPPETFNCEVVPTRRHISCKSREVVNEVLMVSVSRDRRHPPC